eukprot:Hpha_TRINITY_DN7211_c0_g1::TRINITY_DN7211_c0_g1_i1::g.102298::m.102298
MERGESPPDVRESEWLASQIITSVADCFPRQTSAAEAETLAQQLWCSHNIGGCADLSPQASRGSCLVTHATVPLGGAMRAARQSSGLSDAWMTQRTDSQIPMPPMNTLANVMLDSGLGHTGMEGRKTSVLSPTSPPCAPPPTPWQKKNPGSGEGVTFEDSPPVRMLTPPHPEGGGEFLRLSSVPKERGRGLPTSAADAEGTARRPSVASSAAKVAGGSWKSSERSSTPIPMRSSRHSRDSRHSDGESGAWAPTPAANRSLTEVVQPPATVQSRTTGGNPAHPSPPPPTVQSRGLGAYPPGGGSERGSSKGQVEAPIRTPARTPSERSVPRFRGDIVDRRSWSQSQASARRVVSSELGSPLPGGWRCYELSDGKRYYASRCGRRTWLRPTAPPPPLDAPNFTVNVTVSRRKKGEEVAGVGPDGVHTIVLPAGDVPSQQELTETITSALGVDNTSVATTEGPSILRLLTRSVAAAARRASVAARQASRKASFLVTGEEEEAVEDTPTTVGD